MQNIEKVWMKYDNVLSNEIGKCPKLKNVLINDIIILSFKFKEDIYEKGRVNIERTRKIWNY